MRAVDLTSVLILRSGALGDAVLTLPVLHALRGAGAKRVTVLGTPRSWEFLNPQLTDVRVVDVSTPEWMGLFQPGLALSEKAPALLAEHSAALLYLLTPSTDVEAKLRATGVANVLTGVPPLRNDSGPPHAAEKLLAPLRVWLGAQAAALQNEDAFLDARRDALIGPLGNGPWHSTRRPLLLHPGSGGKTKCWPLERFITLAQNAQAHLSAWPVFIFGPAEESLHKEFQRAWPKEIPHGLVVNVNLRTLLGELKQAQAFVGNDAGVAHLAARCAPTIAIFGPTDPRTWRPLGTRVRVCAPAQGPSPVTEVSFEQVWQELQALWTAP